jgi:CspA family cold shock protein
MSKGYGFIEDELGADIFVHHSAVQSIDQTLESLSEGQKVEFDVVTGAQGRSAQNVHILS